MTQIVSEAGNEARRQYWRQYYQTHKEQKKEYNKRYWEKKAKEGLPKSATNKVVPYDVETFDTDKLMIAFNFLCKYFNDKEQKEIPLNAAYEAMRLISNYCNKNI